MLDRYLPSSVDVLVTGSEGFIGKRLCKRLKEEGISFFRADVSLGIDLCALSSITGLPTFGTAVHLAAKTFIPDSWIVPQSYFFNNIVSTLNILEACRIHGARLIMASTYVYGVPLYLPISEQHPLSALNPYTHSKLTAETLGLGYAQAFSIPLLVFRPFNVYGPGQDDRFLIPSLISQWKTGTVLLKDPEPRRDYLHVDDMVEAYVRAIRLDFHSSDIINIGSGISYSVREVVDVMKIILPGNTRIDFSGEIRKEEIPETRADITKAEHLLDWKPQIILEEGLRRTVLEA